MEKQDFTSALARDWATDGRWDGIARPYSAADVYRLRGSIDIEYSLASYGAARLWRLLRQGDYFSALSATTRHQAVPAVPAGPKPTHVHGWHVGTPAHNSKERDPPHRLSP